MATASSSSSTSAESVPMGTDTGLIHLRRKGKAPPVDPFTGENPDIMLDDWLPSLDRASEWNS